MVLFLQISIFKVRTLDFFQPLWWNIVRNFWISWFIVMHLSSKSRFVDFLFWFHIYILTSKFPKFKASQNRQKPNVTKLLEFNLIYCHLITIFMVFSSKSVLKGSSKENLLNSFSLVSLITQKAQTFCYSVQKSVCVWTFFI